MKSLAKGLVLAASIAGAFAAGLLCNPGGGALMAAPQGRGTAPPPPTSPPPTSAGGSPSSSIDPAAAIVYPADAGQSGSANGFIAVTGSYGVGTSVLYVLDTTTKQLAVYEARGGSQGSRRLVLVGARRIDLDLQLEGYNDYSEFSYRELTQRFDRRSGTGDATGDAAPTAGPGAAGGRATGKK